MSTTTYREDVIEARRARLAMIEALRAHLGAVPLQIGGCRHIGRVDAKGLKPRILAPGMDPAGLLDWCAAEQMNHETQVWIKPDPKAAHPWLFADDVPNAAATAFAAKRAALVLETSPGNCQLRILADRPMTQPERKAAQDVLCAHLGGDDASTSGEKWGRLAGYTNQKLGSSNGFWTRLLRHDLAGRPVSAATLLSQAQAIAAPVLAPTPTPIPAFSPAQVGGLVRVAAHGSCPRGQSDGPATAPSRSEDDFRWACDEIRAGAGWEVIIATITTAALARGKRQTEAECREYAERTIRNAQARITAGRTLRE